MTEVQGRAEMSKSRTEELRLNLRMSTEHPYLKERLDENRFPLLIYPDAMYM